MEYNPTTGQYRPAPGGAGSSLQKESTAKTEPERQALVDEYMKAHPGATRAQADTAASAALQAPQRAPIIRVPMFTPGPNGQETLNVVRPGQSVAAGARTAAGLNSTNTPTTTQRTAAGRAETVLAMVPEVTGRIDSMRNELGPVMGRWNDFMQGKVGSDAPNSLRSALIF